jgi:hypothetical protein
MGRCVATGRAILAAAGVDNQRLDRRYNEQFAALPQAI